MLEVDRHVEHFASASEHSGRVLFAVANPNQIYRPPMPMPMPAPVPGGGVTQGCQGANVAGGGPTLGVPEALARAKSVLAQVQQNPAMEPQIKALVLEQVATDLVDAMAAGGPMPVPAGRM